MSESLPESFCKWPFFNLMINARGDYLPCCKYIGQLKDDGIVLNASTHTIDQAFHSSSMKSLRKQFLAGAKPKSCEQCWDEEAAGVKSMRFDGDVILDIPMEQIHHPEHPIRMDIYPSNICNLRCRICNPRFSTAWIDEGREMMGIDEGTHLNLTTENLAIIEKLLPGIQEFGFFGGEPLYQKEAKLLLKKCVDTGHAKHISVAINTNTTIYSPEFVEWLTQFRKVYLNFSIDDIEERFEYQRKNANWKESVENVRKFAAAGGFNDEDQLECKICCTVSSINIFYLPELLNWAEETFPGIKVYLNFLHGPSHFCVRNLAEPIKDEIRRKLLTYQPSRIKFDKQKTRTITDTLELLGQPGDPFAFCAFFDHIERGDAYRNESFGAVFPEYYELLKKHDPRQSGSSTIFELPILSPSEARRLQLNDFEISSSEAPRQKAEIDNFRFCKPWTLDEQFERQRQSSERLAEWSNGGNVDSLIVNPDDRVISVTGQTGKFLDLEEDLVGKCLNDVMASLISHYGEISPGHVIRNSVDELDHMVVFGMGNETPLFLRVATLPRFDAEGKLVGTITLVASKRNALRTAEV